MIPMGSRYAWHVFGEAQHKCSRVMPLSQREYQKENTFLQTLAAGQQSN